MTEAERKSRQTIKRCRKRLVDSLQAEIKHFDHCISKGRELAPDLEADDADATLNILIPEMAGIKATLEIARNVISQGIK